MTPLPDSLLESVAAAAVREGLADAIFTRLSTPLGRLLVVQGERGVVRVSFEEEPDDRELAVTRDTLDAYFAGEGDPHELPFDLSLVAAPFRHAVLETLHDSVARGQVVTYGALAKRAGNARAYRAAATACARNPIPIIVPCHRVLPSSGGIGDYGGGPERKRALLELEGALTSR
jgi:methylated-DNA-[protein]-cysteine S-methyltransferase